MIYHAYVDALRDQILRDAITLASDESCHVPSADFYVDRIAAYRAEVWRLEHEQEARSS